ncbi:vesicular-fusion protein S17 [Irineochytrium annulatum]|nr:vesicular-fusion protein S17 [Irineochytrium annulatum]
MADREGQKLMEEAAKRAASKGWLFGMNKMDEAADLYQKAHNSFKLAKLWKEAGDASLAQADVLIKMGEKDEAATSYLNAAKAFKKTNPNEAITALQHAVAILTEKGRFASAASNQKQIAEIYENDIGNFEEAKKAYGTAAEWYQGEDSVAQADACLIKVGTFAAQLGQYDEAIEQFEDVASRAVDNKLTKWSVRDYFFKAGLCLLCLNDHVRTAQSLEKYKSMDVTFEATREYAFLRGLVEAIEGSDVEAFTTLVVEFDKMTKLDSWKTSLLLTVKKSIQEEDEGLT